MLEIIGVVLCVLMVAIIVVAEFLIGQSQAVAAERDRTIDARSTEIRRLTELVETYRNRALHHDQLIQRTEASWTKDRGQILGLKDSLEKYTSSYETLRMEYDQLHAAHKLLKNGVDMTTGELNAMTLERDRLLEVIKLRDEKIDKLVSRTNELNSQIDGLKYKFETRGGQSPDLNTAWHMKEKQVDVKQKYLLDDTPLDENGSSVIDSQPYGE